jgi:hypothetical protein
MTTGSYLQPAPENEKHCKITRQIHLLKSKEYYIKTVYIPERIKKEQQIKDSEEQIIRDKEELELKRSRKKYNIEQQRIALEMSRLQKEKIRLEKIKNDPMYHLRIKLKEDEIKRENEKQEFIQSLYRKYLQLFGTNFEFSTRYNDFGLNSEISNNLRKELQTFFGVKLNAFGDVKMYQEALDIYDDIIKKAYKLYDKELEEAKLDKLATIEANRRLKLQQMEQRIQEKMKSIQNEDKNN